MKDYKLQEKHSEHQHDNISLNHTQEFSLALHLGPHLLCLREQILHEKGEN